MAVSTAQHADVAQVLASVLGDVDGLRVVWWVSDATRPPAAVLGQPTIDYLDPDAPFCFATYTFPVSIVVNRNTDRDAQADLSRLTYQAAAALAAAEPDGIFSIEPTDARPSTTEVGGISLPSYLMYVRVRA
jgi:hypothetical protein